MTKTFAAALAALLTTTAAGALAQTPAPAGAPPAGATDPTTLPDPLGADAPPVDVSVTSSTPVADPAATTRSETTTTSQSTGVSTDAPAETVAVADAETEAAVDDGDEGFDDWGLLGLLGLAGLLGMRRREEHVSTVRTDTGYTTTGTGPTGGVR